MKSDSSRSRRWTTDPRPRYWWHRLPGMDYVPPIYADLTEDEWGIIRDWFEETDQSQKIGECVVPLISLLHGFIMGNRADRIVQLGTCSGYSTLLIGFMLRRMNAGRGMFTLDCDPEMCAISQRWLDHAGLASFVGIEKLNSTEAAAPKAAIQY